MAGNVAGGFDFGHCLRNAHLAHAYGGAHGGAQALRARKTGTTIVGLCYAGGVVLGADTRATEGPIVADKNCEKVHYIAPNMYCAGAGTAADTEAVTQLVSGRLALHRLNSRRRARLATAMTMLKQHLFRHQGHVGAALVLGGVDASGPHLYAIYPHGSTDQLPYVTMGSGSLAAMAVFEAAFRPAMAEAEAVALVKEAVRAGILNDLGSGSAIDVVVIAAAPAQAEGAHVTVMRNCEVPSARPPKVGGGRACARGSTAILRASLVPLCQAVDVVEQDLSSMDISSMDTS